MAIGRIPKSAPFADEDIDLLNRVVAPSTPIQRAWLAGFLAGLDAASGEGQETSAPVALPRASEPINIVYATESGNSEKLAGELAKAARSQGLKPSLIDMADLDVASLPKVKRLVVIAATWGEGEPPARATRAYSELMGENAPSLAGVQFAVLALGDSAYARFCETGRQIDARLAALGGERVIDHIECDLDFAAPAAAFNERVLAKLAPAEASGRVIAVDFSGRPAAVADNAIVEAEVGDHINLNSSQSDKQTFHIELLFPEGVPGYQPGDALDVYPENDAAYVDALLKAAGLTGDATLRQQLIKERDVTTLSLKTLQDYVAVTGHQYVKAVLDQGEGPAWIAGRQLLDLIELFPIALDAEKLIKLTRPLPPRAYSIASSRSLVNDEVHVLVAPVRYTSNGRKRAGVASNYLAGLKKGDRVRVKLRANKHFRLPAADKDVIMIGAGTGVAPFRAFVQERQATHASGRSWLIFGDRRYNHDFLYQLEWQDALKDGALSRIDVAFSRDGTQKVYVQDRLWDERKELVSWLDSGAALYVCGDAKAMAKDLRNMLIRSVADVKNLSDAAAAEYVSKLESERRYLQDVY
jgi:sulfite reductase (NADPH) flavoprotein alpha-component